MISLRRLPLSVISCLSDARINPNTMIKVRFLHHYPRPLLQPSVLTCSSDIRLSYLAYSCTFVRSRWLSAGHLTGPWSRHSRWPLSISIGMCVTFAYINNEAAGQNDYQMIILNNRDEHFDRSTSLLAWEDDILCGRDEASPSERGTWFGMTANGRIGILLSILEKNYQQNLNAPTRGSIVKNYLKSKMSSFDFVNELTDVAHIYNGFNVLLFDRELIEKGKYAYYFVNYFNKNHKPMKFHSSGIYGFGNCPFDKPFKKVTYGKQLFSEKIEKFRSLSSADVIQQCLEILTDKTDHHPDPQLLSQTDQDEGRSSVMSQLFYEFPYPDRYGTRSHSVLLVDGHGHCTFFERSRCDSTSDCKNVSWVDTVHHVDLESRSH